MYTLKQELRWHVNNGCKVRDPNNGGVISNPDANNRAAVDNQDSPDSTTANSKYIDTTPVAPSNSTASSRMPPNKAYLSDCKQQEQAAHKS